jgi:hypothetical protein
MVKTKKEAFDWDKVLEGFKRPSIALVSALLIYYFSMDVSAAEGVSVALIGFLGLTIERLYSHLKWQSKQ